MRKFPLHIEEENMRKMFAIDAGYELIDINNFIKFDENEKREYLARIAITLFHIGCLDFFPPKTFWGSTTKQLKFLTEGFINGDKAQKVQNKIGWMFLVAVLVICFLTSMSVLLKVLSVIACVFVFNNLQNKWLGKVVIEYALGSPYGLLNMWNAKLLAMHIVSTNSTYDKVVTDNLFEDIILNVLAWDDLMTKPIVTRLEYFQKTIPKSD